MAIKAILKISSNPLESNLFEFRGDNIKPEL